MHFDQFNTVKKEKLYFFTTHPIFSLVSPGTFQTKTIDKSIAFFFKYTGL